MLSINRNLVAIALAAALSAPMAYAGDKNPPPAAKSTAKATDVASQKTTDAVSQKTTEREAGRVKNPTPLTPAVVVDSKNPPPGKGNWWADADLDDDGKLSVAEAKANAGVDARFGNIDADADGFLTSDEYRNFYTSEKSQGEVHAQAHSAVVTRDVWTKLDANSDGKLSSSEVSSNTQITGSFSVMDSNGDGFVTQAEYSVYAKKNM